jgi:DNA-binding CsgD family transcriptional regulator
MLANAFQKLHIRFLGWGFITAWGMIGMLMGPQEQSISQSLGVGVVTSSANVCALLAVVLIVCRSRARFSAGAHSSLLLAVVGTLLMTFGAIGYLLIRTPTGDLTAASYISLSVASCGFVLQTARWGQFYASSDAEDIERFTVWSTLLCSVLYLAAVLLMPPAGLIAKVLWVCLPLASGLSLLANNRTMQDNSLKQPERSVGSAVKLQSGVLRRRYARLGSSVLIISFSIALSIGLLGFLELGGGYTLGLTNLSGLVFAVLLVVYTTFFAQRLNLDSFYRLLSPLLLLGLLLIVASSWLAGIVGASLILSARWVLYFFLWIYLAELCQRSKVEPLLAFPLGLLAFEIGALVAFCINTFLLAVVINQVIPLIFAAFALAVFFVVTTARSSKTDNAFGVRTEGEALDKETIKAIFQEQVAQLAKRYSLSPRESEILQFLVRGYSLPYIRNELYIAQSTIETHAKHIYKKLGIHSREELLALFEEKDGQGTE